MTPYRTRPSDPWMLRDPETGEIATVDGAPVTFETREAALAWVPPASLLPPGDPPASVAPLTPRQEAVRETARAARAQNTLATYESAWKGFRAWCGLEGRDPFSGPALVAEYLRDLVDGRVEGRKAGSIRTVHIAMSAICAAYADAGHPNPSDEPGLRLFLRGLRREMGMAPHRRSAPVTDVELRAMLDALPAGLMGIRDRALLLVGWAGCMRRSEIVGLDVGDVVEAVQGFEVTLRRSKTDQDGRGVVKVIPRARNPEFCPVTALKVWLARTEITEGPLFRGIDMNSGRPLDTRMRGSTVARIVKRTLAAAGLDPAKFSGHSLRAGFLTAAARMGASERQMMNQSGHQNAQVMRGYIRRATVWEENAALTVVDGLARGGRHGH